MSDEAFDPTLRPLADVGTTSVTIKGRAKSEPKPEPETEPAAENEFEPEPADDIEARMHAAGFRLHNGAWRRVWH
jgi:hypothetical protein